MRTRRPLLLALLLTGLTLVPAQARLGETLDDIRKQFGKPGGQPRKDNAFWLIEGNDGLLNYTVTFNAQGKSIAEGLKPVRRARFTEVDAMGFIEAQIQPWTDSPTLRTLKPGDSYRFAGREFVCAKNEHVVLDEPGGLLLIWTKTESPAVMVVSAEMLQRVK
jgi:hypothetical protein